MQIRIDSKTLISKSLQINTNSEELLKQEFKVNKNAWGDLNIVKFDNIKAELVFNDRIHDKRSSHIKGEVILRAKTKKKFIANNIVLSNKRIHISGEEERHILIEDIKFIDFTDQAITINTAKQTIEINTKSFQFNVYIITLLEWINANNIDESYVGKKIKFQIAK